MRTTAELREGFLSYFESKDHLRRPSAPLIPPADDPSTLFIVAGMQPMKRWFLGLDQPPSQRIVTSQKVMRAGGKHADLDDVGSTARHASFFEMLGNFSFGDYFKDEAITLAWEFVTEQMGFPRSDSGRRCSRAIPSSDSARTRSPCGGGCRRPSARPHRRAAALRELLAGR